MILTCSYFDNVSRLHRESCPSEIYAIDVETIDIETGDTDISDIETNVTFVCPIEHRSCESILNSLNV